MSANRLKVLLGVAGVLAALLVWNWIAGWGLVTVHVISKPLSEVIRSIERQGGIKLVTNADVTTAVTMDVDRVPPAEAVDVLAARLDGNWSVGYIAGPTKADVATALAAVSQGERNRDFRSFGFGGGGGMDISNTAIDARRVVWKVSPSATPQLQAWLDQISQKTGLAAMVPRSWDPAVSKTPSGGDAASAMREIIRSVKGEYQEVFILRVDRDRVADAGPAPERAARTDGGFGGDRQGGGPGWNGGGRQDFHPEWMVERTEARIAQLPKEEQDQARKDFSEIRALFEQARTLPEDQRAAAMQQLFDRPDVQERMADRQAARDEKSGPQRRAERARNYIQRKSQMMGKSSS